MARLVLSLALVAVLAATASAYPSRWVSKDNCGNHPSSPRGRHGEPVKDSTILFTVKDAKGATVTRLCAGSTYTVTASWDASQHALLTTSQGEWASPEFAGCKKSTFIPGAGATSMERKLVLPCSASGKVEIKSTRSAPGLNFMQATLTLPINCKAASCPKPAPSGPKTILAALQKTPNTKLVLQVAKAAGLTSTLSSPSTTATVLVPSDQAFLKLLGALKLDLAAAAKNPALLKAVLSYHIIPGKAVLASQLKNGQTIPTALKGQSVQVKVAGSGSKRTVTFLGANKSAGKVVRANIKAGKAVVHVIDSVLIPRGAL